MELRTFITEQSLNCKLNLDFVIGKQPAKFFHNLVNINLSIKKQLPSKMCFAKPYTAITT